MKRGARPLYNIVILIGFWLQKMLAHLRQWLSAFLMRMLMLFFGKELLVLVVISKQIFVTSFMQQLSVLQPDYAIRFTGGSFAMRGHQNPGLGQPLACALPEEHFGLSVQCSGSVVQKQEGRFCDHRARKCYTTTLPPDSPTPPWAISRSRGTHQQHKRQAVRIDLLLRDTFTPQTDVFSHTAREQKVLCGTQPSTRPITSERYH